MIIAGCPISGRDWIAKSWVNALALSCDIAGQQLMIATVVPQHDVETTVALQEACETLDIELLTYFMDEDDIVEGRDWTMHGRFQHMVNLRNTLLFYVRLLGPSFFLSVDSDILLSPEAVSDMMEDLEKYDAACNKTWLSRTSNNIVNGGNIDRLTGGLRRSNTDGVTAVDIIMAIKLMSPDAYSVDYQWNDKGEDIGWSLAAKEAGLKLCLDGRHPSKHCMRPEDLLNIDKRLGW